MDGDHEEGRGVSVGELWLVRPESRSIAVLMVCRPACRGPGLTPGLVRRWVEQAMALRWPDRMPVLALEGLDAPVSTEGAS